jgi:DNA polymerase-3 subunit gamma/tau
VADVHGMLGTAADGRLGQLVRHLVERDAAAALTALDAAVMEGVDVGQLLDQLLGYLRDVMAACVGCPADAFLHASRSEQEAVVAASKQLGLPTVLAAMQILDQTISRLARSMSGRTLAELALVRICALEDLQRLPELLSQLSAGGLATSPAASPSPGKATVEPHAKKKFEELAASESQSVPAETMARPAPAAAPLPLTADTVDRVWRQVLDQMGDLTADNAAFAESVAISGPNRLAVSFAAKYDSCKAFCERPERAATLEQALSQALGQPIRLEFRALPEAPAADAMEAAPRRPVSQRSRLVEKAQNPLVKRAEELFKATPVAVEDS